MDGSLRARDLASKNGTTLNGSRLRGPSLVGDGDVLMLGDVVQIEIQGVPAPAPPVPAAVERLLPHADDGLPDPIREHLEAQGRELDAHRWAMAGLRTAAECRGVRDRLQVLVDEAAHLFGGSAAAVMWRGRPTGRTVSYEHMVRVGPDEVIPHPSAVPRSILGAMLELARPVWSNDLELDPRFNTAQSVQALGARQMGCIPVGRQGALFVFPSRSHDPAHRARIELFAEMVGATLAPSMRDLEPTSSFEPLPGLVGQSDAMRELAEKVRAFAHVPWGILLVGERGTGKSQIARAIHELSRPSQPFVLGDCASIHAGTAASTLFGHAAGAFTDARGDRTGWVGSAGAGTLFLDEVAELPVEIQPSLLVLLEEHTYQRLGDDRSRRAECRVVSATNRVTSRHETPSTLRDDLYDRLAAIVIRVPPLRERRDDVPLLAEHLFKAARTELVDTMPPEAIERLPHTLSPDVAHALRDVPLPGNVRSLRSVVRRALTMAMIHRAPTVLPEHLDDVRASTPDPADTSFEHRMTAHARRLMLGALAASDGTQSEAARRLGLTESQWYHKRKKYQVTLPSDEED